MIEASGRLRQAGYQHAVPISPELPPRLAFIWMNRHLPGATAAIIPCPADGEYGVGFLAVFQDRTQAEAFERGMAGV